MFKSHGWGGGMVVLAHNILYTAHSESCLKVMGGVVVGHNILDTAQQSSPLSLLVFDLDLGFVWTGIWTWACQ